MTSPDPVLRRMILSDLDTVREWRNTPAVREFLLTRHEIGAEEHRRWFEQADRDPDRRLLIFETLAVPSGFVQFTKIRSNSVVDWGFYVAPMAARGTGRMMGRFALAHAFDVEEFSKVCGQAMVDNVRSCQFHLDLGFVREGVLRSQHHDGDRFHDVALFGLLRQEWDHAGGALG